MESWHQINFSVPIKESAKKDERFLIRGVAINETITRNGTMFVAEELSKGAESLKNKPILKDHDSTVDSIVGQVTNSQFSEANKRIEFEGNILDEKIQEKINKGLIKSVSVGAFLKDVEEIKDEDSGETIAFKALGIDFVELSLVAVPADPNAGFSYAVAEAYKNKSLSRPDVVVKNKEETTMAEEAEQSRLEELREESAKLKEEVEALKIAKLEEEKAALTKQEAEPEPEPEKPEADPEPVEDKTEGEVATEDDAEEKADGFELTMADGGYGLTANYEELELKNYKRS